MSIDMHKISTLVYTIFSVGAPDEVVWSPLATAEPLTAVMGINR